jgi:hypothetical protein
MRPEEEVKLRGGRDEKSYFVNFPAMTSQRSNRVLDFFQLSIKDKSL